jgi:hypothetical protein
MVSRYERFVICSLLTWLAPGCGDKGGGNEQSNGAAGSGAGAGGASGSSGMSASGQGGGAGTTAGSGGSAGTKEPTPPPEMPRELGPPDGIYCRSQLGPTRTCPAGSRCCPYFDDETDLCMIDGGKCPACDIFSCGQLLCDGPEDCPAGQFCCYAIEDSCKNDSDCTAKSPAFEDSYWISVECQTRCVSNQRDPDHGMVVCKDDRDCPGPYEAGQCLQYSVGVLPYGLKICSGSGT